MESGGKKKMELWVKIILSLAALGCIGAISYGCVTLNNMKQNEVQQAAVSTTIEVTDSSSTQPQQASKTPETKEVDYELEAETAFKANELPENIKEQFIADYIAYREKGLSVEDFLPDLLDKYLIASQEEIQANVSSEDGEIETEEDEAYQAQLNKEAQAEQSEPAEAEPAEADFEVLYLDNTEMYAQSNVNIRAGAGITYDKVGSLSQNEAVTVIGLAITKDNKEWYQLGDADGNLIGYVSASYLGKSKVQVQQSQPAPAESSGQQSNSQATESNQAPAQNNSGKNIVNGIDLTGFGGPGSITGGESGMGLGHNGSGEWSNVTVY